MDHYFYDLLKAAQLTVKHCGVKPDETAVVLTDSGKAPAVGDAFYSAGIGSGAETIYISMTSRPGILIDPPEAVTKAMIEADIVFDAVSQPWPYTTAMTRICEAGTRVLQVLVPEAGIIARTPDPAVIDRGKQARKLLSPCKTFRITSDLGTDVTFHRGDRPAHIQDGVVTKGGEWDSVGTGFAVIAPIETKGDGVVYIQGTVFLPMDQLYITEQPIRMDIEGGRVVNIERDHELARTVDDWLRAWNDPNSYVIAHTGFGIDSRAKLRPPDPGAWESILAGVNIAFGGNTVPSLGGANLCQSHLDFVLPNVDVEIDGVKIITDGNFTPESGMATE